MENWMSGTKRVAPNLGIIVPEVHFLTRQNKQLQDKVHTLTQHLHDGGGEFAKAQIEKLNKYADEASKQLKATHKLYMKHREENAKLKGRLDAANDQIKYLEDFKIKELEKRLEESVRRVADLEAQLHPPESVTEAKTPTKMEVVGEPDPKFSPECDCKDCIPPCCSCCKLLLPSASTSNTEAYSAGKAWDENTICPKEEARLLHPELFQPGFQCTCENCTAPEPSVSTPETLTSMIKVEETNI